MIKFNNLDLLQALAPLGFTLDALNRAIGWLDEDSHQPAETYALKQCVRARDNVLKCLETFSAAINQQAPEREFETDWISESPE